MHGVITSTTNPRIKAIRKLHHAKHRRTAGLTIVEGPNGREALARTRTIPEELLILQGDDASARLADTLGITPTVVDQTVMDAASNVQHAQGPVAVVPIPPAAALRRHNTVGLVDIADPGNLGTIVRAAVGFGWDVAVFGNSTDPWSPKAIRSAAGATLDARVVRADDPIAAAGGADLVAVALMPRGGTPLMARDEPVLLLVGSEAHGLAPAITEGAAERMTIDAAGVESLNAATSAAIAMYAMSG